MARLDISFDAGATFITGNTPNRSVSANSFLPGNLTTSDMRLGTASGSVVVRAMMSQSGGTGIVEKARLTVTAAPRN